MPHLPCQIHLHLFLQPHILFFFGCTNLETTNQPLDFDCDFVPAIKFKSDSDTMTVTTSSSFNMPTMARSSFFLRVQLSLHAL